MMVSFLKYGMVVIIFICTFISHLNSFENVVVVEMTERNINTQELVNRIDTLPEMHRARFKSIDGQIELLELMINEIIFYRKSVELGYDQRENVQNSLNTALLPILNTIYFNEVLDRRGRFDPNTAEDYYRNNIGNFIIPPVVSIQYLQTNEIDVERVMTGIISGTDFEQLIETFSMNIVSKRNRGIINQIRLNGFISGLGFDSDLNAHIADASIDTDIIHGPFETASGIHFFKKLSHTPAVIRPFREVQNEIIRRETRMREVAVFNELMEELNRRYNIQYFYDRLNNVEINALRADQHNIELVTSSHPDISFTVAEAAGLLIRSAQFERIDISNPRNREGIISREVETRILSVAASDANTLQRNRNHPEVQEVYLGIVLTEFTRSNIGEKIQVTDNEIIDFFNANQERYTIATSRNIRQFVAKDERSAKRHRNTMQRHLKKNDEEKIINLIRTESLFTTNNGMIHNIYQNDIIPHVGVDRNYANRVWSQRVGQLSPVFRNINNDIVFFYVVHEEPARVRNIIEVENSIRNMLMREKYAEIFEQIRIGLFEEYAVVIHYDRLVNLITADELFNLAEEAQRQHMIREALSLFNQIVNDFPDTIHEYRAMFMRAFLTSEILNDSDAAIKLFEVMLEKYPEGDLNESAEFMLEALKLNVPIESMVFE
jgi:hypothetical protein